MIYKVNNKTRRILRVAGLFCWPLFLCGIIVLVDSLFSKSFWAEAASLALIMVVALVVLAQSYLLLAEHHKLDIETDARGISYLQQGSKYRSVAWSSISQMRISYVKACIKLKDHGGHCLFRISFLNSNFPDLYAEVYRNVAHERTDILRDRYRSAWHILVLRYSSPLVFGVLLWGSASYIGWMAFAFFAVLALAAWRELAGAVSEVEIDKNSIQLGFPFRSVSIELDDIQSVSIVIDTSYGLFGMDTSFFLEVQTSRSLKPFRLTALDADLHEIHAAICSRVGYERIRHGPKWE